MTDPTQSAIPGTDMPPGPVRRRRGRPLGSKNNKAGTLFSDGQGDFRVYVFEEDGTLVSAAGSGGFADRMAALRWLRQNGGRDDLLGHQVVVMHAISIVRVSMQPTLQFKPRVKVARPATAQASTAATEPETVST